VTADLFRIVIRFDGMHLLALLAVVILVAYWRVKANLGRNEP
jgi:hypothetical protein